MTPHELFRRFPSIVFNTIRMHTEHRAAEIGGTDYDLAPVIPEQRVYDLTMCVTYAIWAMPEVLSIDRKFQTSAYHFFIALRVTVLHLLRELDDEIRATTEMVRTVGDHAALIYLRPNPAQA